MYYNYNCLFLLVNNIKIINNINYLYNKYHIKRKVSFIYKYIYYIILYGYNSRTLYIHD